ncbi:hypothetical protein [uncultured Clostridium sp.]|uniref:hypothetical protein n=1 Tax=uncultured Clostridium sp. TaxID=59620 RepID=UPI00272CE292|nr:hypothetical protein [uncultured Clostridium sp.]
MIIKKYEYGSIYSIASTIEYKNEILKIGTPVRLIEHLDNEKIMVEDFRGKSWEINEDDILHKKIEKAPKNVLIYKLLDRISDYLDFSLILNIILGTVIIAIALILYLLNITSVIIPLVMISIGIVFYIMVLISNYCSLSPNIACFGNTQNIEELKILLNNDTTKVRIGCTPEEMPQGEEYKDFYFSDNYVGNLSTIAYDYLKESGKPGECVPILDDKNIVRGLRVIIYEEDATLNYKCVKIKNNNGEEENE